MSKLLEKVQIQGLLSLRDTTLEFSNITVLIGPNGAGKSNLLKSLKLLSLLKNLSLGVFVGREGGASSLLHYGPKATPCLSLSADFQSSAERFGYATDLAYAAGDQFFFQGERAWVTKGSESQNISLAGGYSEARIFELKEERIVRQIAQSLAQMTFFHFHDTSINSALRTQSRLEDDRQLRADGNNLAAFLLSLMDSAEEAEQKAWRRINLYTQRIVPSIKSLAPTRVGDHSVRLNWIDDRDEVFGSHHLSDGSLRAIALITAMAQPTSRLPRFISIDEPELGLHPSALSLIAELAHSISRHTQVLFATQSTDFLGYFSPEDVVVVERSAGESVFKRLNPEALEDWLKDYSLPDLFEKGVIGGRPS